jgi:signal transduction histidine kinase
MANLSCINDPARLAALNRLQLLSLEGFEAFDRLGRLASRNLKTPAALVSLVGKDRQYFKGCIGLPEPWSSWRETPLSHSICQHVVALREPLVIPDTRRHPVICENLAIRDLGIIAYLGIPLITHDNQVIGSFCVADFQPREWTPDDVSILEDFTNLVMTELTLRQEISARKKAETSLREAQAVLELRVRERTAELAKLNEQLQADVARRQRTEEELQLSREQLRALAGRLQLVREEERSRIARDIHDVLAQELTRIKIDIAWMQRKLHQPLDKKLQKEMITKTAEMLEMTDSSITTVQRIASDLRPVGLDTLGLASAVEWQAQDFQKRTGLKCLVKLPEQELEIDSDRATALFRIVQECLTNVIRHAQAKRVQVTLEKVDSEISLEVRDNGVGISEAKINDPAAMGLLGMRERALQFGGSLRISGKPGRGTVVKVALPIGAGSVRKAKKARKNLS